MRAEFVQNMRTWAARSRSLGTILSQICQKHSNSTVGRIAGSGTTSSWQVSANSLRSTMRMYSEQVCNR
ncbi:hypothetical protein CERSUDRAFT_126168, partial [Gelatoporia subvermispora B]